MNLLCGSLASKLWKCLVAFERVLSAHVLVTHLDPEKIKAKTDADRGKSLQLRDQIAGLLLEAEMLILSPD